MAHRDCPEATACFIRKQAEKLGISIEKTIDAYSQESGLPRDTLHRWVWPRKPTVKNDSKDKPSRKQTNPELKSQLDVFATAVREGQVSDDDVKRVMDAGAEGIASGKISEVAGTRVATAVGKKRKSKKKRGKGKSDIERLLNAVRQVEEGLFHLVSGKIKPESKDDHLCVQIIRRSMASIMFSYARMGIDLAKVVERLQTPRMQEVLANDTNQEARLKIIDAEGERLEIGTLNYRP